MPKRHALLVGSMPFDNEEQAMGQALNTLGAYLHALPDGEIGEVTELYTKGKRAAWVQAAIDLCAADKENWNVVKPAVRGKSGFPTGYETGERLSPKHPPKEMVKHLNFRYHEYFRESYPIFQRLREESGLHHLKFQVGVPTGLGIAFGMLSPVNAFRYSGAFNKRLAYEVNEILKIAGDDVIIQVEIPAEVALAYRVPKFLINIPINSVLGLVKEINPPATMGIHLCLGDLNNEALVKASTLDSMVHFANKLVEKWPSTHKLLYVHYPLAEAADPPPVDVNFYAPLKHAKLPNGVRFIAGFIHEKRSDAEHQQILTAIENLRGERVEVACSCGMGRRSKEVGEQLIGLTARVADM